MTVLCAGDPDHVHLPRGQVGGPAQPECGAQLPSPPLGTRAQTLESRGPRYMQKIFFYRNFVTPSVS
jgi:hypothetical protein